MNQKKSVKKIVSPRPPHFVGDGFRVHNFIPSTPGMSMQEFSPFIMLDYNSKYVFPPTDQPRGVDVHPHRGFETVTIAYHGRIAHHDSYGNSGVIGQGEVQWMTAAAGILHKEYHEETYSREGGPFQMVQLWVNLPARYKMSKPKYQRLTRDMMATYTDPSGLATVEVIAGQYRDAKGPAETFTPVHLMNAKMATGAKLDFQFPAHYSTALLVIEGSVMVDGQTVPQDHMLLFGKEGTDFQVEASEDTVVLVLSGEPIHEPIAAHGPFVMNTREEIIQAVDDYHDGKFGFLE